MTGSRVISIVVNYSAKMEALLLGMRQLMVGLHPPPLPTGSIDLVDFPELPAAEILQGLSTPTRVVYCVVMDPAPSQRHDKIGMMTGRHRVGPCRYRDGGGKWDNFTVTRGRPRWISHGHVS